MLQGILENRQNMTDKKIEFKQKLLKAIEIQNELVGNSNKYLNTRSIK